MRFHPGTLLLLILLWAPTPSGAQETGPALLRAGDELVLRVWPDTTLSGRYRVETDGSAYLPLLGEVEVIGRPLEELRSELISRYGEIMQTPVVVVVPRFRVSVLGAVRSPGLYFMEPPATLIDAVSMAGGFAPLAQAEAIRLVRDEDVFGVDAETALRQGGSTASVTLQSGDRIVVPAGGPGVSAFQVIQTVLSAVTLVVAIVRLN